MWSRIWPGRWLNTQIQPPPLGRVYLFDHSHPAFALFFSGAKQTADTEGPGTRHAAQASRVDAGAGVQAPGDDPEGASRADSCPAPDGAHQPAGVQQEEGEGAEAQACHGGPAAAQKSKGTSERFFLAVASPQEIVIKLSLPFLFLSLRSFRLRSSSRRLVKLRPGNTRLSGTIC